MLKACRDLQAQRALSVRKDLQVFRDPKVLKDQSALKAIRGRRVCKVFLATRALPVRPVHRDLKVSKANLVLLERKDLKALPDRRVHKDLKVLLARLVRQALLVLHRSR